MFHALKGGKKKSKKPSGNQLTLGKLADDFLDDTLLNKAQKTCENLQHYLQSFVDHAGKHARVIELTGEDLDVWTKAQKQWAPSTKTAARAAVLACLNWGATSGRIVSNPMQGMKRGSYQKRERILNRQEREKIRNVLKGGLKDFVFALEQTGARPYSEVAVITASMVDWERRSVTIIKHKAAHKDKNRVIYLSDALLLRMRELAEEYPEGPLFRTAQGKPWTRQAGAKVMRRLERRSGVQNLTAGAWRPAYITDSLAKGMGANLVARLVGNSARTFAKF